MLQCGVAHMLRHQWRRGLAKHDSDYEGEGCPKQTDVCEEQRGFLAFVCMHRMRKGAT